MINLNVTFRPSGSVLLQKQCLLLAPLDLNVLKDQTWTNCSLHSHTIIHVGASLVAASHCHLTRLLVQHLTADLLENLTGTKLLPTSQTLHQLKG